MDQGAKGGVMSLNIPPLKESIFINKWESLERIKCEHCGISLVGYYEDDEEIDYIQEPWFCSMFCYEEDVK